MEDKQTILTITCHKLYQAMANSAGEIIEDIRDDYKYTPSSLAQDVDMYLRYMKAFLLEDVFLIRKAFKDGIAFLCLCQFVPYPEEIVELRITNSQGKLLCVLVEGEIEV